MTTDVSATAPPAEGRLRKLRPILHLSLTLLVFAFLPWAAVEFAFFVLGETGRARIVERFKIRQEKALAQISLLDDNALFASRAARRIFELLRRHGVAQARRELARVEAEFPRTFELIFFDGRGKVMTDVSSVRRGRAFLERCYATIGAVVRGESVAPEQTALLRELWQMSRVEVLRKHQDGQPMAIGEDPSAGYCSFKWGENVDSASATGYLAFYHPDSLPPETALLRTIRAAQKLYPTLQFGSVDTAGNNPLFTPSALGQRPALRAALLKTLAQYDRTCVADRQLITVVPRKRRGSLFAVQTLPEPVSPALIRYSRLSLLLWSIFLLSQCLTGRFLTGSSISHRVVGLFLFSVGLPALLLLVGAYRALEDHRFVLLETLERTMRDRLRQFDERFPFAISRIEDRLSDLKRRAEAHADQARRLATFKKVAKERSITDFLLINDKGHSIWDLRKPENSMVAQRYQIGRLMAREIMKRLNNVDQIDAGTLVSESVNSTMSTLSDAGSWELFQRNLGRFTPFGLANEGCFMLFDAVRGPGGPTSPVRQMICSVMFRAQVESRYFLDHRKALERQPDLPWRVSIWSRTPLMRSVHSRKADTAIVDEIGRTAHTQQSSIRKIVHTSEGDDLVIGQLGQNLQSFVFVARAPLAPIERRVAMLWQWTALFAALLLLATFVIGRFLSDQLLHPINELGAGIQAIRRRDFHHQVPVRTRDELGDISLLMNRVIEEMRDLSMARAIQETLFPPGEIRMNSLCVFGRSRTLSDVGGDYFDYVQLDEHRLFGLVGDVSGHGVSAALIMGMAKCYFSVCDRHQTSLSDLLAGFNQYLFQTVKRKKMMTLVLFRWRADTRTLEFANGGHVSPYLRHADTGQVEELSMPCMPLGVRLQGRFAAREAVLQEGDSVLLLTDGLPEAKNPDGLEVGYQTPPIWFQELGDQEPRAVVEALTRRLEAFRNGAPINDDVTMICLRMSSASRTPAQQATP